MWKKTAIKTLPLSLTVLPQVLFFIVLSILSFFIPFSFGHPQWLVGTMVNACLFLAAMFLPARLYLPIIFFPSLGILARGIIFGPFTPFLVYFLPFIWLANLILIISFKKSFPYFKYLPSVFISAAAKFLFLLAIANIYFNFHIVPKIFLSTMGIFQFLTALGGGIVSFLVFKVYAKRYNA
jgi:hypothetical protein